MSVSYGRDMGLIEAFSSLGVLPARAFSLFCHKSSRAGLCRLGVFADSVIQCRRKLGWPMLNEEEGWIAEFEAAGEDEVRIRLYRGSGMHPEAKFHAAVRWLRDQARARKLREEEIRRYVWWTLCAAVLSLIVGVIVLAVTWFGR